jgi:hypothetical protein
MNLRNLEAVIQEQIVLLPQNPRNRRKLTERNALRLSVCLGVASASPNLLERNLKRKL